jgi:hypothetical protein
MRRRPHFVFRVYFTDGPEGYYVVGAGAPDGQIQSETPKPSNGRSQTGQSAWR